MIFKSLVTHDLDNIWEFFMLGRGNIRENTAYPVDFVFDPNGIIAYTNIQGPFNTIYYKVSFKVYSVVIPANPQGKGFDTFTIPITIIDNEDPFGIYTKKKDERIYELIAYKPSFIEEYTFQDYLLALFKYIAYKKLNYLEQTQKELTVDLAVVTHIEKKMRNES